MLRSRRNGFYPAGNETSATDVYHFVCKDKGVLLKAKSNGTTIPFVLAVSNPCKVPGRARDRDRAHMHGYARVAKSMVGVFRWLSTQSCANANAASMAPF